MKRTRRQFLQLSAIAAAGVVLAACTPPAVPGTAVPKATAAATAVPKATAGQVLPASEIKDSLTLQQVSDQCAIPLDVLYQELKLPSDLAPSTALKDISSTVSGFEITLVRDLVAAYQAM